MKFLLNPTTTHKMANLQKHCQTPLNHRFQLDVRWPKRLQISKILSHASKSSFSSSYLVLSMILTFWSFSVKFPLNPITAAQKITNFQNTVRRLIIILVSLFFLLIIRACIWGPHGKNLPEPRYHQKDDQFAKYCHASQSSYSLSFLVPFIKPTFWALTLNFLLNLVTKESMTNLQTTVKRLGNILFRKCFAADHQSDIFELLLWNSRRTTLWSKRWPIFKTLSDAS